MYGEMRTFSSDSVLVQERREYIRSCATTLFVKQPFDKTSMSQIIKACGMSKGGLYHYVGSKKDILTLIIQHAIKENISVHLIMRERTVDLSTVEALREAISIMCHWIDSFQDEMIVLNHEVGNLSKEERKPLLQTESKNVAFIEKILRKGVEAGEFKIREPKIFAHNLYLAIEAWAYRRWYLRNYYSLEKYIESLAELTISTIMIDATELLKETRVN